MVETSGKGKKLDVMKKHVAIFIIMCIMKISACAPQEKQEYSIYLLDEDISAISFSKMDIEEVYLQSTPIISSEDILSYELVSHRIMLTPAAYKRLQRMFLEPVRVTGIPFVVCVSAQRIYAGALWTPLSSISYDGVVILQSFEADGTTIQLSLGYPGPDAFTGSDPRSDPRILRALEQAEKLKPFSE